MDAGYRDKSLDSEELRNRTHELIEKMRLGQKGLSNCLQETLKVLNSSKETVTDKSQSGDHQKYGILVRSYDLSQQSTTKQKLVALAKHHSKKNCLKSPNDGIMTDRRKGNSFAAQLPDRMGTSANIQITSASEKSMPAKDNAVTADHDGPMKAFEASAISTSYSGSIKKNMSNGELETQQNITPNLLKRRRIIDKNIKVNYGDVLDKIGQEYDLGLGLNYSYSDVNTDSDDADEAVCMSDSYILDALGDDKNDVKFRPCLSADELSTTCMNHDTRDYQSFLSDPGNIKSSQRSILKQYKGRWPVTGGASCNCQRLKSKEHKLLGYDWIASVLDNGGDTSLEISDEYFEELRNFWKEQQGRPIDDLNLLKNFVDDSQEPQLIKDILAKSKIQAYRINDRLFPEAVQKNNTSSRNGESALHDGNKQRPFVSPRYVSVTVPNNIVEVNSAAQSHHRGSVDSSESLSLGKHCVLGWDSSCLNVPPVGTTLSMKDALPISKGRQVLTLEEAEDLAKGCHRRKVSRFVADHTNASYKARLASLHDQSLPKEKNATKDKRSDFLKRVAEVTNPEERTVSSVGGHSTNELLDSAYALMRDLNQIKQEHKMKRLAKIESGGIP